MCLSYLDASGRVLLPLSSVEPRRDCLEFALSINEYMPTRVDLLLSVTAGLAVGFFMPAAHAQAPTGSKPNIVFILADDLGWKDTGAYHSYSFETPNIDKLAGEGVRFTRFYTYPSCSPSRSGFISGMDPDRLGITAPVCHQPQVILHSTLPKTGPPFDREIEPSCVTRLDTTIISYASVLHDAGYTTGHFGKWHLGREPYSPLQHGFDVDVPHVDFPGPSGSYTAPWNKDIAAGMTLPFKPGDHLEDHMAQEACAFIDKNKDHPFLLDYWAFSVHSPLKGAKEDYVQKYKDIHGSDHPQNNPVYASMVKSLDDAVGTLEACLEKDGLAQNTIVVFASDNGGVEFYDNGGMDDKQYQGTPATSNSPLRAGKGTAYEGGVREPFIVKWPGVTKAGTVTSALAECMDVFPTFIEAAGGKLPDQPLDGYSLVPLLNGTKASVRNRVFCIQPQYQFNYSPPVYAPVASVTSDQWKLIKFYGDNSDGSDRYELHNLSDDIGETFDFSAGEPEIVATLSKDLDRYTARIHAVLPVPNPNFNPTAMRKPNKRLPSEPVVPPDPYGD
jgi:arylsulfatase A-like enzyme